ncbi:MAG TPA: protein kinase [Gemmatimonadaceae bacterium]|nr:protein kinase [Gemmatimonadaceae bacterium]
MSSIENRLLDALGGRYRIDRELGGGGMSRVFVAEETRFGRTVVIKVLTHELAAGVSAERFEREIKLAAQLQQANIVPVIDAGEIAPSDGDPTLPYYTMPYVDGESLRARLIASAASAPLAVGESVAIMRDVARALAYAHAHGVIHRDIKPENVLLSGGAAVVTDFGIAKAVSASKTQAPGGTLTVIGTSLGTPAYMAPEQAVGGATDARADIYAWGIVAYELLAGAHPFAGKVTAQQFVAAHIAEAPVPLTVRAPGVPPSLGALVMRCIEKDPDARVASAAELVAVLESPALLDTPGERRPSSVGDRRSGNPPRPSHGWRVLTRALAITLVIGAAIAVWKYVAPADGVAHGAALANPANERASRAITTVAVLPFVNNGGTASDEYFSDGITDELAHALSRVPSLRVAGRTSSYAFKGKDVPAQQIGRTLNVGGIVEGTLQRSGDRLRITVQLTSAKDGLVLWSDTYESRATDVFQVQDQFTKQIVQALEPALRGTVAATVADSSRGTTDLAAYDLYLKGRFFWEQRGGANLLRAIGYFKQSIARDPLFARAYAGLSMAYAVLPDYVPMDPDSLGGLAIASARHALTLDSTLADAHIALCGAGPLLMRTAETEPQCRAALAIAPNDPTALQWHAESLSWLGRIPEALSEARRAAALDPLSPVIVATVDQALYASRDFPGALAAAREAIALDSSFTPAYLDIAMAEMFTGHADSAVTAMEMARRRDPSLPGVQGDLVLAYAAAGRWSDAERVRAAIQLAHERRAHHSGDALSLDDLDAALAFGIPPAQRAALIQRIDWESVQAGGTFGLCVPIFDSLRAEPAFIAAERRMGASVCPYATPWPIQPRT